MEPYLLYTSPNVPPQRRFRNSPSAHWCPTHNSSPPVTIPGTNTTGCLTLSPSFLSFTPGGSGSGPVIASVKYCGNEDGMALYRNSNTHQIVQMHPINQQQLSTHDHLLLFSSTFLAFAMVLFLFLFLCFLLSFSTSSSSSDFSFRLLESGPEFLSVSAGFLRRMRGIAVIDYTLLNLKLVKYLVLREDFQFLLYSNCIDYN
jgi:hypothetical protein